jgi:peroxiredoxin
MNDAPSLGYILVCLLTVSALTPSVSGAQEDAFPERQPLTLELKRFDDREISALTATLDRLIAAPVTPDQAKTALWNFGRQLQGGTMTTAQEGRIVGHLDGIARARPAAAPSVAGAVRMVTTLRPGKMAPDIVGRDLNGAPLRLKDYRGKVVVLMFSADWCGICHTLVPYERLLLDLYKNWPFAILSVESGSSPDATLKAKAERGLSYPSWWDGIDGEGAGPITAAWNASGLPAIYVIDAKGVIRFVDTRDEDLLKAVRQLLTEHMMQVDQGTRGRARAGL